MKDEEETPVSLLASDLKTRQVRGGKGQVHSQPKQGKGKPRPREFLSEFANIKLLLTPSPEPKKLTPEEVM